MMGLLGVASGALNAGVVAIVHQTLVHGASQTLMLAFLGLGLGKVVAGYYSALMLTEYSYASIAALRRELIEKLLAFPYASFEQVGRERVYTALTEDVSTVNAAFATMPSFLVNVAVVGGGAVYLLYLSPLTFAVLSVLALIAGSFHRRLSAQGRAFFVRARDEHVRLFAHFRALTEGTKELKQHAGRRHAFLDEKVLETTQELLDRQLDGQDRYQLAQAASGAASLAAIAVILFVMPTLHGGVSSSVVSGYVLTSLYVMGPLSAVLRALPFFVTAEIAKKRIEEIGVALGQETDRESTQSTEPQSFEEIELDSVVHRYHSEGEASAFTLGPVSLALRPSEIVFITGENGSGKSTLAKILLGLYEPEGGEIRWDGACVTGQTRDAYRQLFSVVHADYYLFDTLLGLPAVEIDERAEHLVKRLHLEDHVQVDAGSLSTLKLSQGQRRRLALLTAYLEDRPIYVFDEWGSDQDPAFKEVFYRELVPELRARGKAVVVITHDDRYFDLADRRLALRRGQAVHVVAAAQETTST